jgi:phosphoribosyl 1,2-cyclic phosphodiesterase
MSLTVQSLASGSSGNSFLIRDRGSAILIDAGIGIRRLVASLEQVGVDPENLSAIFITHEHLDHIAGAVRMSRKYGTPLIANPPTLASIQGAAFVPTRPLDVGEEVTLGRISVRSFPVSHDATCPVGYTISSSGATVCYATDTGKLTSRIRSETMAADLLILESNHDVDMLMSGPYPWRLKRRILGDWGHLSNDTASRLLLELADSGRMVSVWLAHLSQANNSPAKALSTARQVLAKCSGNVLKVEVAERDVPSLRWQRGRSIFQLSLFNHLRQ